jgi:hypothetical protein
MRRYYFHVHNSIGFVQDEEGRELPDDGAARDEAIRGIRSILSEDALAGEIDLRGRLDVAVEGGGTLFSVPFAEAMKVER